MTAFAHTVLLVWLVVGIIVIRFLPRARAIAAMYVLGVLFLPEIRTSGYLDGIPEPIPFGVFKLTKMNAIAVGLLIGTLLFDRQRWLTIRPRWFDLPMAAWCISPLITSVGNTFFHNDPISKFDPTFIADRAGTFGVLVSWLEYSGLYDGLVQGVDTALTWGIPYWFGRMYFADRAALEELLIWVAIGGLLYIPFCLAEARLSPQLHRWIYGFHQHSFLQSIRLNGYRPMVFMEHGLAVGLWMSLSALSCFWLWWSGPLRTVRLPGFGGRLKSGLWLVLPLAITAVACKSTGAIILGVVGLAALALARFAGLGLPVALLMLVAPTYTVVRATGVWDGDNLIPLIAEHYDADRAASLDFRLRNEDILVAKALQRPVLGWGGWGRSRVYNEYGYDISISDGLWVIATGERGLFGLGCLGLVVLLPVARLLLRAGRRPWQDPAWAFAGAAVVVLLLYSVDSLMNAMINPVFMLIAGGVTALNLPQGNAEEKPISSRRIGLYPDRQSRRVRKRILLPPLDDKAVS